MVNSFAELYYKKQFQRFTYLIICNEHILVSNKLKHTKQVHGVGEHDINNKKVLVYLQVSNTIRIFSVIYKNTYFFYFCGSTAHCRSWPPQWCSSICSYL